MPPKKRKAAEAIANDDDGGDRATSAKKSKKEAAEAARARAKAWRDSRRQQQEAASTKKTTAATTTTTTPPSSPPPAPVAAPFSTGRKSPRRTTSSASKTTTASKRRRTPVKRGASAGTPSSTRKSSTKSPSSQQKQPAKRSRRNIATDFQFDSSALNQQSNEASSTNTQSDAVADHDATATAAASVLSDSKKKKQQEGKARIEELRKKRQQSGLKVTSPVSDTKKKKSDSEPMSIEEEEEEDIETLPTKSTAAFKTVLVSPGKIGLTLDVNTIHGGASITAVDPSCSLIGQVDVGDIIVSIDGTRITSINDFQVNAHKVRRFGIVPRSNKNGAPLDPPSSVIGGVSAAAVVASTVTNSKTGVDPPPTSTSTTAPTTAAASAAKKRTMPAAVSNIFSQPKTNNVINNAHRPDASLKYDPNQPFPTQGYKMSTAAYCGCGPTPSNRSNGGGNNSVTANLNSTATRVARSGSGTLQQLRESMRNAPSVKRASSVNEDDDQKMPAASSSSTTTMKPSPPGRNGSAPDATVSSSPEEDNDASILKASISRAQHLVSSVAFTNRKRREQLGIKSDSTKTVKLSGQKMASSPTADPPNSAPDVQETVDDMIGATMEESEVHWETPQISLFRKMINGIYSLLKFLLILPVAFGVIYVLGSMRGDATLKSTTATDGSDAALDQVVCFMDYPSDFYSPGESENITKHDDVCGGVYNQCPQWGRCHGGLLRDCNGGGEWGGLALFVPNEAGTSCVPSDGATIIVKIVQDALVNMTVSQSCRSSDMITDSKSVASGAPHPLFSLDVVSWRVNEASEVDITLSANLLLLFQPVFDPAFVTFGHLSGEDTESAPDAIGLSSEVLEHKLPIPFSCQLKFVFMELFGASLKLLYRIIMFLALKGWKYISTHPKSSPVVMLVLVSVVIVRRKKKHRAKVREIFDVVKEEAYDRLAHCEGSGGYAALHLRDDVGHAMYPSNVRERLFMYNYVWPRMIVEVRADNRVRKFRKTADGKQLEHWDLNTNSKRGWQLRKTPNKSPTKSPTKTVEPVGKKRDP